MITLLMTLIASAGFGIYIQGIKKDIHNADYVNKMSLGLFLFIIHPSPACAGASLVGKRHSMWIERVLRKVPLFLAALLRCFQIPQYL